MLTLSLPRRLGRRELETILRALLDFTPRDEDEQQIAARLRATIRSAIAAGGIDIMISPDPTFDAWHDRWRWILSSGLLSGRPLSNGPMPSEGQ
jgi:hypothetical protein